ncbi:MAG: hypothetical protein IJZ53_10305 [Tyzzerella sp.]|nr:hypothetical protein [Tyzzerella sp.]
MKKSNKIIVTLLGVLLVSLLVITGVTVLKRYQRATAVTADVSWYDENGKEFTITTAQQLYGLAQLSESHDFKGQTIKLDADIVVNEGNAEDWVKTVPEKLWIPITGFAGKFDGQGHTISGIYGDSIITSLGLFTDTQKTCVIKDLKLVNSCFKNNNEKGTGSIIGIGGGKLENIYSDAVIVSAGKYVGGLIGRVIEKGENQITNCWFDGAITMKGADASEVGGLVGAYTVEDAINAIQHCLSTADIECMGKQVGGIVGNLGSNSFLNLIDTMYTGTLKYDTNYYDKVGSAIGVITGGSSAIIKDTYTVDEIANRTIGTTSGYQEGSAIAISATELTGVGGYQWTTLDFENYWSAQTDEMPILTYFAEKSESVAGLDRLVDISWYNPTGLTFEIKNAKQFYGFAYLSRSYDFSGQTIKLGADITINEGNAEDWQEEAPKYKWTPIAWHGTSLSKRFKGNFDGQGHTISGIYVKGDEDDGYIGLFGEIYNGSVVKNFKIVNRYFEGTMDGSVRGTVGSVCGRLRGTIDSVYSDAIIVNSARMTGGIAGMINGTGQNTISNCWFDGKITGVSRMGGILGGVYGNKANIEGTIEHCLNTGDIAVQIGKGDVGGMCGIAETWCTLYIKDCLNAGTFSTVGEGAKANTHIGTIFGSVTQTDSVGSKVIISNSFGTKEFYDKLVGWKFGDEGIEQSSVAFVSADEVKGYGGYQWTTLDFKDSWAVRTDDVPVPVVFATSRPSVSGIARMVDYSWYDANSDVMTIKTYQQLYAMARLWDVTNLFKDKTIKLGADIVVNEGNAADWAEKAPALVWEPMKFNGTFDGQGHTISGIYVKGGAEDNYVGLFHRVYQNGTVKNLKLVNSYIEGTMAANQRGAVGSIAGRNNGIIDTVYSNAIVVNSARMTGGIVGMITGEGENVISNSWFDGKVTGVSRTGGILGGVYGNKENIEVDITHCLNTGHVAVQIGYGDVGGLCGMVETGGTLNLTDSLNAGTFATVGEGKEPNTHIGTLVGSVTKTDEVSSKVVMKHVYGVKEFYSKLVGWSHADKAVSQSSVALTDMEEINGYGGYQWTSLDFDKYWAVRITDVPTLVSFAGSKPSLSDVAKIADYSWYDPNNDEYIITTMQQLYGFAALCNDDDDYFADKTVKLGADITVNSGDAADWTEKAPALEWIPVKFKGTFDGQGHEISGIYVKGGEEDNYIGLFYRVYKGGTVKDFTLVNSYFEGTMAANQRGAVGSIAGRNNGTIEEVRSDAIVVNSARMTGGIVGMITGDGENTISNCWFEGDVTGVSRTGGILGGVYGNKENIEATIEHCLNTGDVAVQIGYGDVGGICGMVETWATLNLTDNLNAGTFATVGEGKEPNTHIGTVVGSVTETDDVGSRVVMNDTYGLEEFYEKVTGWNWKVDGKQAVTRTLSTLRELENLKGYGAYQWTTLDFEDTDGSGEDKAYWVLKDGAIPALAVFDEANLKVADAKELVNYSWYDVDGSEYIINSTEQFKGYGELCNVDNTKFTGKTIKLAADITLNEGTAIDWMTDGPEYEWKPKNLNGTFDGQGHTISGLYIKNDELQYVGLFSTVTAGSVVENLTLDNSYVEGCYVPTGNNPRAGVGSIAGRNHGTIDTVQSNAIVKNCNQMTGGIAGMVTAVGENLITNCLYDGQIYAVGSTGGILGGTWGSSGTPTTSTIEHCLSTGTLNITSGNSIGGLCGRVQSVSNLIVNDSLAAGTFVNAGTGSVGMIGAVAGTVDETGSLKLNDVYGVEEFSTDMVAEGVITDNTIVANPSEITTTFALRSTNDIKGKYAYQWTSLDFDNEAYWVLKNENLPSLAAFEEADLDLEEAKELTRYSWYADVEGKDTYIISSAQQMYEFNKLCASTNYFDNKTVQLGADIKMNDGDAEEWSTKAPKTKWTPSSLSGTFDGKGHTISGMYVKAGSKYAGMFNTIYSGAVVKDFNIVNSYFESTSTSKNGSLGSVAGRNQGTIESIYSEAILKTEKDNDNLTGGIAGMNTDSGEHLIKNCWFAGTIHATNYVGGIQGGVYKSGATIEHCLNTGELNVTSGKAVGGLFGYAWSTSTINLSDSLSAGTLIKEENGSDVNIGAGVGQMAGECSLTLNDVYGLEDTFSSNVIGDIAESVELSRTSSAARTSDQIKGIAAYQWTTLDFEDDQESDENDKYWVLKESDEEIPALAAFCEDDNDSDLIVEAKELPSYIWYAADFSEYTISTPEELKGFSELSENIDKYDSFNGKTIKLDADISLNTLEENETVLDWMTTPPEYKWEPQNLKGTFDGQGHTISGVYVKTSSGTVYTGFFKAVNADATVKNLIIENSYFEGTNNTTTRAGVGSVAGRLYGTIDTVKSSAIVKNVKQMTGGIAGMYDGTKALVKNCWFDGEIYAVGSSGGILGGGYSKTATIEHCLNTGTLNISSGEAIGGLLGRAQKASNVTILDSLNAGTYVKVGNGSVSKIGSIVGKVDEEAILRLSDVYGGEEFSSHLVGEGVITDDVISASTAATITTTFALRSVNDIKGNGAYQWTTLDFEDTDGDGEDQAYWVLRDGEVPAPAILGTTGLAVPEDVTPSAGWNVLPKGKSTYTISSTQQLYEFSKISYDSFKDKTINIGADITLNVLEEGEKASDWGTAESAPTNKWTPTTLSGTFDGQGHTLSGVYVKTTGQYNGLFNTINQDAVVKELKLINSYIEGAYSGTISRAGVGSIAGRLYGTIDSVYSDAVLKNNKQMTGGIVGMACTPATITNCWFNGRIDGGTCTGGILGGVYDSTATIEHCLNTGTLIVATSDYQVGGLVGRIQVANSNVIVKDSMNAGTASAIGKEMGNIFGRVDGTATVSNVYGITNFSTSSLELCGKNETNVTQTQDTAYEISEEENYYGNSASGLSFYADDKSSADDGNTKLCWWRARTDKLPMLESFEALAESLEEAEATNN